MTQGDEPPRHVVVFDCNVYLDVARLIGEPFTWRDFDAVAASHAKSPFPHSADPAVDSLRALAVCTSGRFAGDEVLEVWTSNHIDATTIYKAEESVVPDQYGLRGLGWSRQSAEALVDDLVTGLISRSNGGTVGDKYPDGDPPLDHEDGLVYGACRHLAGNDPLCTVYCVTGDGGFIAAHEAGSLPDHTIVLSPWKFVALVRRARSVYSVSRMRPP